MQKIVSFDRIASDNLDDLPLGNILQRLVIVAPRDAEALRVLAIDRLRKALHVA